MENLKPSVVQQIANEQFARPGSDKKEADILGPPPESDLPAKQPRVPSGLPAYLAGLVRVGPADAGAGDAPLSEDELPQV
jgi:hypothetical protein